MCYVNKDKEPSHITVESFVKTEGTKPNMIDEAVLQ